MRMMIWLGIGAALILYLVYGFATIDRRPNDQQITTLIENATTAIQDRDFGGTVAPLSKLYQDEDGRTYDQMRLLVMQGLRTELNYTIQVEILQLKESGDTATAIIHATVQNPHSTDAVYYSRTVVLNLTRENGRHALLMPVKVWRVTSTRNLGLNVDEGF